MCHFSLAVNSTHELGPLVDLKIPANKTRWTLNHLNFSTRYKFYFYAQTSVGSGSQITEEAITTVDEGKLGMYKIHIITHIRRFRSSEKLFLLFFRTMEYPSYPITYLFVISHPNGEISYFVQLFGYLFFKTI